jgi:competence protein ComEC
VTLRFDGERIVWRTARGPGEDRPWSKAPTRRAPRRGNAEELPSAEEERMD